MYCIKCGVELAESEKKCPLCGTRVYHPDFPLPQGEPTYPPQERRPEQVNPKGLLFILTMLFVILAVVSLLVDLRTANAIVWSGFVIGGLVLIYVMLVLPFWFRRPNPAVFIPCSFAALALYVLYINSMTNGHWFFSLALPVIGISMLITTAVAVLFRYLRRGRLYIIAGTFIACGLFAVLIEYLVNRTFGYPMQLVWSIYPLAVCALLSIMLFVIAICKPLQFSLHKKFFL